MEAEANQTFRNSERTAALESTYQHLATKEDVANLRTDFEGLRSELEGLRSEFRSMRWFIAASIGVVAVVVEILNRTGV